ncbi:MAG: hypothetical protein ACRC6E_05315, partial [Fusobacteriaceae bacterium]
MLFKWLVVGILIVEALVFLRGKKKLDEEIAKLKGVNGSLLCESRDKSKTIENNLHTIKSLEKKVEQIKEQTNVWVLEKEQDTEDISRENEKLTAMLAKTEEERFNDCWDYAIELDGFIEEVYSLYESKAVLKCLVNGSREARREFIKTGRYNAVD